MLSRSVYVRAFAFLFTLSNFCAFALSQEIVVADRLGDRVLTYNTDGSFKTTLVVPGNISKPTAVALIPGVTGTELLVGSTETGRIVRFNPTTGAYINEFVAPGIGVGDIYTYQNPATNTTQVLVADFGGTGVRRYETNGTFIDNFGAGLGAFSGLDLGGDGNLYVSSYFGGVYKFNPTTGAQIGVGSITALSYNGQGVGVAGIKFLPSGEFVTSLDFLSGGLEIARYDASGTVVAPTPFINQYNPLNPAAGGVAYTSGFANFNGSLLVTSQGNNNVNDPYFGTAVYPGGEGIFSGFVQKYDPATGAFQGNFLTAPGAGAFGPADLTINPVPEPSTVALVVMGAAGMLMYVRRRSQSL